MVIRRWSGRADPSSRDRYPAHFRRSVLPELRAVPGFLGARLLEREDAGLVEYVVLTRWTSMDAIRGFAGDDPSRAVVEPEAIAALRDHDREAQHYMVVENAD